MYEGGEESSMAREIQYVYSQSHHCADPRFGASSPVIRGKREREEEKLLLHFWSDYFSLSSMEKAVGGVWWRYLCVP